MSVLEFHRSSSAKAQRRNYRIITKAGFVIAMHADGIIAVSIQVQEDAIELHTHQDVGKAISYYEKSWCPRERIVVDSAIGICFVPIPSSFTWL